MSVPITNMRAYTAGWKVTPEIIFDPDDYHIKIDGFHDIKYVSPITGGVELDIDAISEFLLYDLIVTFNDHNEFLNIQTKRSGYRPFRNEYIIDMDHSYANGYFYSDYAGFFRIGDWCRVGDGTNSETFVITNITTSGDSYRLWYATGQITNDYSAGCTVIIEPFVNKPVYIYLKFDNDYLGTHESQLVFMGKVREPFKWVDGEATVTIYNLFADALNKELTVFTVGVVTNYDPQYITDGTGALVDSLTWTKTGSGTLADVTIYNYASCGKWEVEFSDATNFTVTGPRCKAKAGTTAGDFYDQTDSGDSQIKIAAADWGGTPDAGDILTFYVSVNYEAKTVPEILLSLLLDHAVVGYSNADWSGTLGSDPSSYLFDYVYDLHDTESKTITISFYEQQTVADAIAKTMPHYCCYVYQSIYDGKLSILYPPEPSVRPVGAGPVEPNAVQSRKVAIINSLRISKTDYYNKLIINYGWDYSEEKYQYSLTYPADDDRYDSYILWDEKKYKTINLPYVFSDTVAETIADIFWRLFGFGGDRYEIDVPLSELQYCRAGYDISYPMGVNGYDNDQTLISNLAELDIEGGTVHVYAFRYRSY